MAGNQDPSYDSVDLSSFDQVEKVVQRLYLLGTPQDIAQTQDILQRFQRSNQGWQLADASLQSQDENVRFFGALTFTIKINSDWDTLKEEDIGPLLQRLLQWVTVRVNAGEGSLVIRKLCASLVAYFLRPTVSWNRCLLHLLCCLNAGEAVSYEQLVSSDDKDAAQILPTLGRPQLLTALWFSVTLIEEVGKTSPASLQTYKYHERVISTLDDVVQLIRTSLQPKPYLDVKIGEEGVKCFQAWVTYAHGVWTDKADELASLRQLTPHTLRLLWHEGLSEVTADCLGDILNPFSAFFTGQDLETLVGFLTSEQAQNQLSSLLAGELESEPMAIARLLLAYGDASIQDLAKSLSSPTVQLVMSELMQLLACDGYAGVNDEICSPALEFWQSYTEFLIDSLYGADDQAEPWIDSAEQYVVKVIEHCWVKVRFPPDNILAEWTSDAKVDFRAFRADVEDLLQSSYTLLGTAVFDRLANLALEALQNHAWLHLEATLFCLNALSETISDEDVVDGILSKLFGSALFANMMDSALAIPSKAQQTAVATIINFTAFFERHTQFLPSMLTFLFTSLRTPALAAVAAKAIYSTCDTCRKNLSAEVGAFLNQYEVLLEWQGVESATKERVIGAVAAIIQAIRSDEHQISSFSRLLDFVDRDIEACQESARNSLPEQAYEKGLCALRCLINMGKSMQEPDGAAIDLEHEPSSQHTSDLSLWASTQERIVRCLNAVSTSLSRDGEVVEAICQVLRTGYKETSPGPFVFPPKITEDFVTNSSLQTPRLEYVLDTAGAMLTRHTRAKAINVDTAALTFLLHLFQLIWTMGNHPANEPEISASCIDLATRYIPHYLYIFLHPRCRDQIANFAVFAVQSIMCEEIMPRRAAASFWASLFQRYELSADVQAMTDSVLNDYGPHVTRVIVYNISGEAARSELETLTDPLKKMVFAQPKAKQWLLDALFGDAFPKSAKVGEAEKRMFLQQVMNLRGAKKTNQVVKEWWMACRGTNFAYTS